MRAVRCRLSSALSLSLRRGCTWCRTNKTAMAPANSTCANFFPGHILGPAAQGKYVPSRGSKISSPTGPAASSCSGPTCFFLLTTHRLGRQLSASAPQISVLQCNACELVITHVFAGRAYSFPAIFSLWTGSVLLVDLGRKTTEPLRRRVSSKRAWQRTRRG